MIGDSHTISSKDIEIYCKLYRTGFHLIPLIDKVPLFKFAEYFDKKPSKETFAYWLGINQVNDFAILTGTGENPVVVIDADNEEAAAIVRQKCPPTFEVRTTRGCHFYYRMTKLQGCKKVDSVALGLDSHVIDIKGYGGYVRAFNTRLLPNQSKFVPSELPEFSLDWLPLLSKDTKTKEVKEIDTTDDDYIVAQARDFLADYPITISGQDPEKTMLMAAHHLKYGFCLEREIAINLLEEYGERGEYDDGSSYPWNYKEVEHKFDSCDLLEGFELGYKISYADGDLSEVQSFDQQIKSLPDANFATYEDDRAAPQSSITSFLDFQTYDEFRVEAESQTEDWLIENWLEFSSLAMITGLPFSGKSTLVGQLLGSALNGGNFGLVEVKKTPVLLIDLENKSRYSFRNISKFVSDPEEANRAFIKTKVRDRKQLPFDANKIEETIRHAQQLLKTEKILVVVDTFRSAFAVDELDQKTSGELLYNLQFVAQATGAAILILHHKPKSGAQYAGSTAIAGALDYLWSWNSNKETHVGTLELSARGDCQAPMIFKLIDGKNVPYNLALEEDRGLEFLIRDELKKGKAKQEDLVNAVVRSGQFKIGRDKLREHLKHEAEQCRYLISETVGRTIYYSLISGGAE